MATTTKTKGFVLISYIGIFSLFFIIISSGVGQYWDWTFPYYIDQISNLYTYKYLSWTEQDFGSPLLYSSDYFLRLLLSSLALFNPEILRYVLLVATFSLGSYGVFLIAAKNTHAGWAYLLGIGAFINPAILYKLTAGHFNYLIAYVLFIYLIYFLFYKYNKNLRSAVIAGLLLALMGVQIQFLILGAVFIALFFLFKRDKFGLRQTATIAAIAVLVHAVWLSNFLSGGASIAGTSSAAAAVSVEGSMTSAYSKIFTFYFSKATLIDKFYAPYSLLWHSLFFIFLPAFYLYKTKSGKNDPRNKALLLFLLLLILLATGILQLITLYPLSIMTPLFREVGHFAPLIVLSLLLIIAFRIRENALSYSFSIALGISILLGINSFYNYPQNLQYAEIRNKFQPVKSYLEKDNDSARVLYYPFFNQYSFIDSSKRTAGSFPLENSGHDSFFTFSGKEYVNNAVPPHSFKESPQYRLLKSYDLDVLKPYNVKYIVNVSHIYESNYDQYVPRTTYDNNIKLIKNDPHFMKKLSDRNPGKLKKVSDNIFEIVDYTPRISTTSSLFAVDADTDKDAALKLISSSFKEEFNYIDSNQKKDLPYANALNSLFNNINEGVFDESAGKLTKEIVSKEKKQITVYSDLLYSDAYYRSTNGKLSLFTVPAGQLVANGEQIKSIDVSKEKEIFTRNIIGNKKYYLEFENTIIPIKLNTEGRIGTVKADSLINLIAESDSKNIIKNSSFEEGLWQEKVQDCNNYDDYADISMGLQKNHKTDGAQSLEMTAKRHFACTTTEASVDQNTSYLLSFDYQSPNTDLAHYYISFDGSYDQSLQGSTAIKNQQWHNHFSVIKTPQDTSKMKLYVYAREKGDNKRIINRYDNFSLRKIERVASISNSTNKDRFASAEVTLLPGLNRFEYTSTHYNETSILKNPSFEEGPWQEKVKDCNNHDNKADIAMKVVNNIASHGNSSLQLSARRHIACTLTEIPISESGHYLLSFDVQGKNTKQAGYYLSFSDANKTIISERINIQDLKEWQKITKKITAPVGATSATLYLYSYESDGKALNTVYYDNFQLTKIPDIENSFYILNHSKHQLRKPEEIIFSTVNSTKKKVTVKAAKGPFILNFSESYHPGWKIYLAPIADKLECNSPQKSSIKECDKNTKFFEGEEFSYLKKQNDLGNQHLKLNGYANAWVLDSEYIKNGFSKEYYRENPDGSIDLSLVVYFKPQSYFYIGLALSSLTLLACTTYLVWQWRNKNRPEHAHYKARSENQ